MKSGEYFVREAVHMSLSAVVLLLLGVGRDEAMRQGQWVCRSMRFECVRFHRQVRCRPTCRSSSDMKLIKYH